MDSCHSISSFTLLFLLFLTHLFSIFFFFNDTATTEIYTLSLHDALPISVIADSYIIRDGRLAAPLKANAIRINENIGKILNSIVGITKDVRGTIVWAADEVVYAPEIAVRGVRVDEIAAFMEELD